MSDVATLLPSNATPLESNLEQVTARIGAIPAPFRDLWNPETIPENLLPWLAWAVDVPFWDKDASLKEKRAIVAASLDMHRRRGTLSCYRDMARLAGAELISAVTPPAKTFLAASMTQAERNKFLERMPQLRLFSFRNNGLRVGAMNWKDFPVAASGYGMFPVQSDAAARLGTTAFIHKTDGTDVPLTVIDRSTQTEMKQAVETREIRETGSAGQSTFTGAGLFARWLVKSTAAARLYVVRLDTPYLDSNETLHKRTVEPSHAPVDLSYDAVAETGTRTGIFLGGSFMRDIFRKTNAGDRLYKRLFLFDRSQVLETRGMSTHFGGSRLGMPPHNAEIVVRINGKRSPLAAGRFVGGYLLKASREPYDKALAALQFARRSSDRVAVQTATQKIARTSMTLKSGDVVAGQWI